MHSFSYMFKRDFLVMFAPAAILFAAGITANFFSGLYASARASNYVSDLILSNIPVYDVDGLFIWGATLLIIFVTILCVVKPAWAPFILYALAVFYFTRAGFVALTHIAPFPDRDLLTAHGSVVQRFFGGDDLFFSGHTGAPFLMALVFWRHRILRAIFLVWSIFMGVVVLLGHFHYTIDVLSAFFITYGVVDITEWLFPRARELFYREESYE